MFELNCCNISAGLSERQRCYVVMMTMMMMMTANAVITIAIRLRQDYDPTTMYRVRLLLFDAIRRKQKITSIFRRSHVVVVSQSNRTQIVISITSVMVECIVVSSYCSRIKVESQALEGTKTVNRSDDVTMYLVTRRGHSIV